MYLCGAEMCGVSVSLCLRIGTVATLEPKQLHTCNQYDQKVLHEVFISRKVTKQTNIRLRHQCFTLRTLSKYIISNYVLI
jgi:hypothetical protein